MVNSFQTKVFKAMLNQLRNYEITDYLRGIGNEELEDILKREHNQWNVFRDDLKKGLNIVNEIAVERLSDNGLHLFIHYVQFKSSSDRDDLGSVMQFLLTKDYSETPIVNIVSLPEKVEFNGQLKQDNPQISIADGDTFIETMGKVIEMKASKKYQRLKKQ